MAKFQKGQSGNPAGRPPRSIEDRRLREQIRRGVPEILERLAAQARDGDTAAAKLLLDRVLPPLKPTDQAIPLPPGLDLASAPGTILAALASESMTPDQGAKLSSTLASLAKVIETNEILVRLNSIEAKLNEPPPNRNE